MRGIGRRNPGAGCERWWTGRYALFTTLPKQRESTPCWLASAQVLRSCVFAGGPSDRLFSSSNCLHRLLIRRNQAQLREFTLDRVQAGPFACACSSNSPFTGKLVNINCRGFSRWHALHILKPGSLFYWCCYLAAPTSLRVWAECPWVSLQRYVCNIR